MSCCANNALSSCSLKIRCVQIGLQRIDDYSHFRELAVYLNLLFIAKLMPFNGAGMFTFFTRRIAVNPANPYFWSTKYTSNWWIAAWWLPCMLCAFGMLILSPLLMLFPRKLPTGRLPPVSRITKHQHNADSWRTFRQIFAKKVFVIHIVNAFVFTLTTGVITNHIQFYLHGMYRARTDTPFPYMLLTVGTVSAGSVYLLGWLVSRYKIPLRSIGVFNVFCAGESLAFPFIILNKTIKEEVIHELFGQNIS